MAYHVRLTPAAHYLWTLPMFHCDGWCFPWAVTAAGGLHVCLRTIDPEEIWRLIREEGVTHYCAAPTVLTMIANTPAADTGPPPAAPRPPSASPSPPAVPRPRRPCSPAWTSSAWR